MTIALDDNVSGVPVLDKHYKTVINGSLVKSGWTIAVCQSIPSRGNVSEYVLSVEAADNNVIYLVSVFLLRARDKESRVVFCQRNNGVARVLRKRNRYTDAKVISFPRHNSPNST